MKRILIFASLLSLAAALSSDKLYQTFTEHMRKSAKECADEMGLDDNIVERYVRERHSTDIKPMGCLKACIMSKLELICNGKISVEGLYKLVDDAFGRDSEYRDSLHKIEYMCTKRTQRFKNECQLALEYVNCVSASLDHIV